MRFRERSFVKKNFQGVSHTTLNPKGPGVVRIHLVPAADPVNQPSVAIVNGQDVIPVNPSWAILLNILISEINNYYGHEIGDPEMKTILARAINSAKKVFPRTSAQTFKDDLWTILSSLEAIAYGLEPQAEIGRMSLAEYAPFMTAPHRFDLLVSAMVKDGHWNCNQRCIHCYAAGQSETEAAELDTAGWRKVIDACQAANVPQLTFTGGEPTMRKDLVDLINYASWFVTRLNTNGRRLTRNLCEQLYQASLDGIQITFYSAQSELHNLLVMGPRGAYSESSCWSQTYDGIKFALEANLSVSVNTPLCQVNSDYLSTLKLLHQLGVEYVTCSGLIPTGNALTLSSTNTRLSEQELIDILRRATDYCGEHGMELSFTSPGQLSEEALIDLGLAIPSCGACLSNMAIAPNGNVIPCQSWLSNAPLGNILAQPWSEIWDSPICQEIRETAISNVNFCQL